MLVFWATWSAPTRKSFVELEELLARHAREPVVVIGISVDDQVSHLADVIEEQRILSRCRASDSNVP